MVKETIKYIAIWLFIFVVGSLIVTAIVNPVYRESAIDSIKDVFSGTDDYKSNSKNSVPIDVPSEIEINSKAFVSIDPPVETYRRGAMQTCELVEFIEFQNTISDYREGKCKGVCMQIQKEYSYSACEKEWLICYCVDSVEN